MKILVLSDLHVELSAFTPDKVAADAADVINHELYGGDWERTVGAGGSCLRAFRWSRPCHGARQDLGTD